MLRWAHSGLRTKWPQGHRARKAILDGEMSKVPLPVGWVTDHLADPTEQSQRQSQMSTFHEVSPWETGQPERTPSWVLWRFYCALTGQMRPEMKAGLKSTLVLTNRTGPPGYVGGSGSELWGKVP